MVSLDFSVTYSFRPYHGPGVDSAPNENLLEPSGPHRASYGTALHLHLPFLHKVELM